MLHNISIQYEEVCVYHVSIHYCEHTSVYTQRMHSQQYGKYYARNFVYIYEQYGMHTWVALYYR